MINNNNVISKSGYPARVVIPLGLYSQEAEDILKKYLYGPVKYLYYFYNSVKTECFLAEHINPEYKSIYKTLKEADIIILEDHRYYNTFVSSTTLSRMPNNELAFVYKHSFNLYKTIIPDFYKPIKCFLQFTEQLITMYELYLKFCDFLDQDKLSYLESNELKNLVKAIKYGKGNLVGVPLDPVATEVEETLESEILYWIKEKSYNYSKPVDKVLKSKSTKAIISKSPRLYNRIYGQDLSNS